MAWLDDHPVLEASVTSPEDRSLTVSALRRKDGAPLAAVQQALRQRGLVVGGGYGEWKGTGLRLAHFPAHDPADLDLVLTALDETLAEGGLS
jgi:phosphoserine aminotransferase